MSRVDRVGGIFLFLASMITTALVSYACYSETVDKENLKR